MQSIPVAISGVGPISAVGCGKEKFWRALLAGEHGFGPITLCDVSASPSKIGAEVRAFRLEDYLPNGKILARRLPRTVQFALAAATLALQDSQIDLESFSRERIGVCVGTSLGNLQDAFQVRDRWQRSSVVAPQMAFQMFNHSAACTISAFFDLRGPSHTVSTGCNSGLDAVGYAMRQIQQGLADAMLVVGTDCELVQEIMAALNASKSLSTRFNDDPGKASRPFDCARDGNVIGEGAAALLLESLMHAQARKAEPYVRIAGYANCSAGKQRRYSHDNPDLETEPCVRTFHLAMKEAQWSTGDVDLVNANGSSSILYDRLEALALAKVFGNGFPSLRVHSIKSMLGQHGAGSSALQMVAACLALKTAMVPPTINCTEPDPLCGPIRVVTQTESCALRNVLVHAIGFGGFYYSCAAFTQVN